MHAALVAEKIIESMRVPLLVDGNPLTVSPSIGSSLFPSDHHLPEMLLEFADQAMYQVKARGSEGGHLFYTDPRGGSEAPL